jgi:4-hydroxy-2-oxoheptanedioate aldolase
MRRSKILSKIRAGQVARICALGHFLPFFPEHAARCGYDGVWVDGEHRAFDPREVQALAAFHRLADIDCIWRPPTLEKSGLYRLLEDGVTALMIPHVSTPEKAKVLSEATKFPPLGDRGIDGVGLDADFWPADRGSYCQEANRETFLVVQIETPQAVENMEAIAAVPGVEVLFLGPGDLSLRLGCGAQVDDPQMMKIQERLAKAARKHGKAWGRPVDSAAEAKSIQALGGQLIAWGNEFLAVYASLHRWAEELDAALGPSEPRPTSPRLYPGNKVGN